MVIRCLQVYSIVPDVLICGDKGELWPWAVPEKKLLHTERSKLQVRDGRRAPDRKTERRHTPNLSPAFLPVHLKGHLPQTQVSKCSWSPQTWLLLPFCCQRINLNIHICSQPLNNYFVDYSKCKITKLIDIYQNKWLDTFNISDKKHKHWMAE